MKQLVLLLPLMVGHHAPEDDAFWHNYIRLVHILCLSAVASARSVITLDYLVVAHNKNFCELYPEQSVIPKMHYMLHLPKQMLMFGPLRHHSCMRLEAKHMVFKRRKWRSFKNILKSISEYHQKWMYMWQTSSLGQKSTVYL